MKNTDILTGFVDGFAAAAIHYYLYKQNIQSTILDEKLTKSRYLMSLYDSIVLY